MKICSTNLSDFLRGLVPLELHTSRIAQKITLEMRSIGETSALKQDPRNAEAHKNVGAALISSWDITTTPKESVARTTSPNPAYRPCILPWHYFHCSTQLGKAQSRNINDAAARSVPGDPTFSTSM